MYGIKGFIKKGQRHKHKLAPVWVMEVRDSFFISFIKAHMK